MARPTFVLLSFLCITLHFYHRMEAQPQPLVKGCVKVLVTCHAWATCALSYYNSEGRPNHCGEDLNRLKLPGLSGGHRIVLLPRDDKITVIPETWSWGEAVISVPADGRVDCYGSIVSFWCNYKADYPHLLLNKTSS